MDADEDSPFQVLASGSAFRDDRRDADEVGKKTQLANDKTCALQLPRSKPNCCCAALRFEPVQQSFLSDRGRDHLIGYLENLVNRPASMPCAAGLDGGAVSNGGPRIPPAFRELLPQDSRDSRRARLQAHRTCWMNLQQGCEVSPACTVPTVGYRFWSKCCRQLRAHIPRRSFFTPHAGSPGRCRPAGAGGSGGLRGAAACGRPQRRRFCRRAAAAAAVAAGRGAGRSRRCVGRPRADDGDAGGRADRRGAGVLGNVCTQHMHESSSCTRIFQSVVWGLLPGVTADPTLPDLSSVLHI